MCLKSGLILLLLCNLLPLTRVKAEKLERFTFEKPEMGVPFRVIFYALDSKRAEDAAAAAFSRVEALNRILSDYEQDSELVQLSRSSGHGHKMHVSDELWVVLSRSQKLAKETQGAFDVTCGPIVNLWRRARRKGELPSPALVEEMRARIGWTKMILHAETQEVELTAADMRLDLGGIAKGYACDEVLKTLKQHGILSALVAASGDIVVSNPPPGKKGWQLEIATFENPNALPILVELANMAVATSGDQFQKLEVGERRYSHILDPRTGQPLTDHSLVSVIAPDGLTADSLATTCSVLGPKEGALLVQKTLGTAARFCRKKVEALEIMETQDWKKYLLPK